MLRTAPPVVNRHLVREIDRGRIRELLVVVGLVALLLLPLLAYVWNHMEWIRVGYEMERLKKERLDQAALGERLRIEKASLSSLARVEREARDRLGLVPSTGAVVTMDDERPPAAIAESSHRPAESENVPPVHEAVR
jgi:cell division protein FtsL